MTESSVSPEVAARKHAFRIALVRAALNATQFAKRHNVSKQALSRVLAGQDTSARLTRAIDQFIARYAPEEVAS